MAELTPAVFNRLEAMLVREPARTEYEAQALLRRDPGNVRASLVLGAARRRRGDMIGAARGLVVLAKAHPQMVEAHLELALVLIALGEHGTGSERLKHGVDLDPAVAEAWLESSLSSEPGNDTLRLALAETLYRLQKPGAALGHLEQLLAREALVPGVKTLISACRSQMAEVNRE